MITTGNTVLITGGSSGIGLALAKRFLQLNNKVIITGRDAARLQQIQQAFPGLHTFAGDLTDKTVLGDLIFFIEQEHPDLTILINNAAVQYNYLFMDETDLANKVDYEIACNLSVPVKLTGLLLPVLLKKEKSAVVNVSSGLMIAPKRSASVYCATKAALHSYTKTLRYQLENTSVKIFEIIPSLVDTPMTEGRNSPKISAEQLADQFFRDLRSGRPESYIGKARLLKIIHRLLPALADRIMKEGV